MMRKLKIYVMAFLCLNLMACKEQKSSEEEVAAAFIKMLGDEKKAKKELANSDLPADKMASLIKDINRHRITQEDKDYFTEKIKICKTMVDGAMVGHAVKKVEKTRSQKIAGKKIQQIVIDKVKSELERGLKSTNQKTKLKIISSFSLY